MPTYEYVCSKCGQEFEKMQSMSEKPLTTCLKDVCGQKKWGKGSVQRKISGGGGLLFKGTGFYITDYRSEGYKQSAKKDIDSSRPATTSTSTDKPAAKAESKPAKPAAKK